MKILNFLFAALFCANAMGQSIKDAKILVYKYDYDVDPNIAQAADEKTTGKSLAKGFGGALSKDYYEDYAGKKTEYKHNGGNKLTASLIDTVYNITSARLKEKYNAELLPMEELDGKIKYIYGDPYNALPNATLKLARKNTTGYATYAKLFVSVQRQGVGVGNGFVDLGSTKAIVMVWMEIYDKDGNKIKDVKGEAKGEEPIVPSVNVGIGIKTKDGNIGMIRKHVCMLYGKAMDDLISKMGE